MSTPTEPLAREVVAMACQAPSVHNTQPWSWRIRDARTVELYADRRRQLPATDPEGRDLAISCGAALHHLAVAARAFGLTAERHLLPVESDPDLLAAIHLGPGTATEQDVELLAALEDRTTDRRGFTDWEVPSGRLERLVGAATSPGVHVLALTERRSLVRTEELLERARGLERADAAMAAEQDEWTGHPGADGVPPPIAQPELRPGVTARADRFSPPPPNGQPASDEHADALIVISTVQDDQRAWLRSGEALSALWLRATLEGLSVMPQSHVIEVAATRRRLRRDVLEDLLHPQLVLRVGWQEVVRPRASRTPRRPLDEVLLP